MNDREYLAQSADPQRDKWSPPEWRFDVIDSADEAMTAIYDGLSEEYANMAADQQAEMEREHDQLIAVVCRKLTSSIGSEKAALGVANLSDDFLVAILDYQRDGEDADQLVGMSVDKELIKRHPDIVG